MPTTSVRIDDELSERLSRLAEATGRSKAWYMREALEAYLAQEEWLVDAALEGVREADAGRFATVEEVKATFGRWGVDVEE